MAVPVILTRPAEDSQVIAQMLAPMPCLVWPLTRIVTIPPDPPQERAEAVILSSRHAARAAAGREALLALPAICVGTATADAAKAAGFSEVLTAGGRAADLARIVPGHLRQVLHLRGRHVTAGLSRDLQERGIAVREAVVYDAEPVEEVPTAIRQHLASARHAVVTVWSRRNARLLAEGLARLGADPVPLRFLAISGNAAVPLQDLGPAPVTVAARPTAAAMAEAARALSGSSALRQQSATQRL